MKIHLISDNVRGTEYLELPPGFTPTPSQLVSTPADNHIEFAGRICYDSLGACKSRPSVDYFKHIHEVNHTSIMEHVYRSCRMYFNDVPSFISLVQLFMNRPGCYCTFDMTDKYEGYFNVTTNARTAYEIPCEDYQGLKGNERTHKQYAHILKNTFAQICPLAVPYTGEMTRHIIPAYNEHSRYYSFYLGDVSRNLTHELIRHRREAAVSQRSTRYVDEAESDISWHPLFNKHYEHTIQNTFDDTALTTMARNITAMSRAYYQESVQVLEKFLEINGADKFTARKQARGAARGLLPSALSTELVFTASEFEWRHIINSRSQDAADAEIRLMTNKVFEILHAQGLYPDFTMTPAKDGMGYEITIR